MPEDPEVVEYRKKFIEEMKMKKNLYYTVCLDDENIDKNKYLNIEKKQYGGVELKWKIPIRKEGAGLNRRILMNHDESSYKSGEMSKFKWRFGNNLPFYSKGRGR